MLGTFGFYIKIDKNVGNFCEILVSENPEAFLLKGSAKSNNYKYKCPKNYKKIFSHNPPNGVCGIVYPEIHLQKTLPLSVWDLVDNF